MFQFKNKTVFLISSDRWGVMKVSKHHYALELAKAGAKVFFIEPPLLSNKGIEITVCPDDENISIVKYKPVFRGRRFLPAIVYSYLLRLQINLLVKKLAVQPDVVWCFHAFLFQNLQWFKAATTIYFAADLFETEHLPQEIYSADLLFAVSDTIKERLQKSGKPVVQIHHGLQNSFVQIAEGLLQKNTYAATTATSITAGYTGNLRMQALDRKMMMQIITAHTEIKFLFWGAYKQGDLNLGGELTEEADAFISFLQTAPNVELRGVVNGNQLQEQMRACNLFWVCWKTEVHKLWDGSNSHKLLEYLSTGSPVVAHYVSTYKNTDLLYMLPVKNNAAYPNLFKSVVQTIVAGEPIEKIQRRLAFATSNSYTKQLHRIETAINAFQQHQL